MVCPRAWMGMKVAGGTCGSLVPSPWPLFPSPRPPSTGLLLQAGHWLRSARARDSLFPPLHVACALPAVLNVCLTLFYLLFSPRTLLAHTSSRKPSLTLSSGVSSGSPEPGSHGVVIIYLCVSPNLFMSLSMVVRFSMPCVSSSGPSTELDVRLSSLIRMEPSP